MDFYGWILLVIASLWASALAFVWGLRTGQFAEPERSRYLPLPEDMPAPPAELPASRAAVNRTLLAIALLVLACLSSPILLLLWRRMGG